VTINSWFGDRQGTYDVLGYLAPAVADVPLAVEMTHESGAVTLFHTKTDASGHYAQVIGAHGYTRRGRYSVQVFTSAGGGRGGSRGADSQPRRREVRKSGVRAAAGPAGQPGRQASEPAGCQSDDEQAVLESPTEYWSEGAVPNRRRSS
jgi:hypothetical protein